MTGVKQDQQALDPEPLFKYLRWHSPDATYEEWAERLNISTQGLRRWRDQGFIPVYSADRVAVKLGVFPACIWGDAYFDVPINEVATLNERERTKLRAAKSRRKRRLAAKQQTG